MKKKGKQLRSLLLSALMVLALLPTITTQVRAEGTGDATAPTITDVSPNNASEYACSERIPYSIGAHVDGSMEITFSEAMNTQAAGTVSLDNGGGTLDTAHGSWSSDGKVYTIAYIGLSYNIKYTATVSGFKDAAGNPMADDATHYFTTAKDAIYDTTAYYFTDKGNDPGLYHRDLTVYSAKSGSKLTGISMTDNTNVVTSIPSANYSCNASDDGMAITISQAYLATLSSGVYTLTYAFDGSDTDTVALTVEPNYNYNAAAGTIWVPHSATLPTEGSGYTGNLTLPLTSGKTLSSVNFQYIKVAMSGPGPRVTKTKAAVEVSNTTYTVGNGTVTFDNTFPRSGKDYPGIANLTLNYEGGTSDVVAVTIGENLDPSIHKYEFDRTSVENGYDCYEPNMTMDADGNAYITDLANYRILEIAGEDGTQWGIDMKKGQTYVVYTPPVCDQGGYTKRITTDSEGNLYFDSYGVYSMMVKKSGIYFGMQLTKGQTVDLLSDSYSFSGTFQPMSMTIDNSGNLLIGGYNWTTENNSPLNSNMIVYPCKSGAYYGKSMVTGKAYGIAGVNGGSPQASTVDALGNIYYVTGTSTYMGDQGSVWMIPAKDGTYFGIAMTANTPCKIGGDDSNKYSYTGDGANALSARFQTLYGIAVDEQGNVYVSDIEDHVVREIAAESGTQWGRSTVQGYVDSIVNDTVDISMFSSADSICARKVGDVQHIYILDAAGGKIVDAHQQVNLPEYTLSYDANGGTGAPPSVGYYAGTKVFEEVPSFNSTIYRDGYSFAGWSTEKDGSESVGGTYVMPAANTTLYARWVPTTATVETRLGSVRCADKFGNIFCYESQSYGLYMKPAKSGTYFGQQLTAGTWTKITATTGIASQIFTDDTGNVYFRKSYYLYMVPINSGTYFGQNMTAGTIYTIAGGSITNGANDTTMGCDVSTATVDEKLNIYICINSGKYIMMIPNKAGTYFGQNMQVGYGYIIAGNGTVGDSDTQISTPESYWSGLATEAPLLVKALAVDSLGNLFYADQCAGYMVPAVSGTYFGQPMVAEHVYHVYGAILPGHYFLTDAIYNHIRSDRFDGEEGPATEAVAETIGIGMTMTCDKDGNLYFVNSLPNAFPKELMIRMIPVNGGTYWGTAMKAGYIYSVPMPSVFALYGYDSSSSIVTINPSFDTAGNLQVCYYGSNLTNPTNPYMVFKIGNATQGITVGSQTGTLTAGTAGSATFAATTSNVNDGTAPTVNWCDASGNALTDTPTGLSAAATAVSTNASTVTVTASTTVAAGTYYFTLNFGTNTSVVTSVKVDAVIAINLADIAGVTAPTSGATPVTSITGTDQYTGTVSWTPNDSTFAASTTYTATITLTPKTGYTLTGVAKDFFKVSGAASVSNDINSGVITVVFPKTDAEPEGCLVTYCGAQKHGNENGTYDIRFIAVTNTLSADKVGFVFSKSKTEPTLEDSTVKATTTVYTSILASGKTVTAKELGGTYLIACTVNDIPAEDAAKPLYVRAFSTVATVTQYTQTVTVTADKLP